MKSEVLTVIQIDGDRYSIRATQHAKKRMAEREVDENVVAGEVIALGRERIVELQERDTDIAIVDERRDLAVIIAFNHNRIVIVTVIDKSEIWVKDGTFIEKLY
ncbi:MAG: hypothetical protein ACOCQR_03520 [bacterium]